MFKIQASRTHGDLDWECKVWKEWDIVPYFVCVHVYVILINWVCGPLSEIPGPKCDLNL